MKGHSADTLNDRADKLANNGANGHTCNSGRYRSPDLLTINPDDKKIASSTAVEISELDAVDESVRNVKTTVQSSIATSRPSDTISLLQQPRADGAAPSNEKLLESSTQPKQATKIIPYGGLIMKVIGMKRKI